MLGTYRKLLNVLADVTKPGRRLWYLHLGISAIMFRKDWRSYQLYDASSLESATRLEFRDVKLFDASHVISKHPKALSLY